MRRKSWTAIGLLLVAIAAGCGESQTPEPIYEYGPMDLEVGSGADGFEPIADELLVQRGCQGSQHVLVSLRLFGMIEPHRARVYLTLLRLRDGAVVSRPFEARLPFSPGPSESLERTGLTLVIPEPDAALGELVRLEVAVEHISGQRATAAREARVEWGPDAC